MHRLHHTIILILSVMMTLLAFFGVLKIKVTIASDLRSVLYATYD